MMNLSDVVLDCSQTCLRLAAKCTDDHAAAELHLLALRLMLAAVRDAELVMEELPALPLSA
jgi:hypothetical protein